MSTEYSLKLRATLDTSQVQQELEKLRSQQEATSQSGSGQSGNAVSSSQFAKLDATLSKLNSSLARLTAAAQRLERATARQTSVAAQASRTAPTAVAAPMSKAQFIPPIALPSYKSGNLGTGTSFLSSINASVRQQQEQQVIKALFGPKNVFKGLSREELAVMQLRNGGWFKMFSEGGAMPIMNFNKIFGSTPRDAVMFDQMLGRLGFGLSMPDPAMMSMYRKAINKQLGIRTGMRGGMRRGLGFAGGIVAGTLTGLEGYLAETGHEDASRYVGHAGTIGQGAITGAVAGSVIPGFGTAAGAIIGAGYGATKAVFEELTSSAKKLNEAFKQLADDVKKGKAVDAAYSSVMQGIEYDYRMKKKDKGFFDLELAAAQAEEELLKAGIATSVIGDGPNALENWNKETERMFKETEKETPEIQARKEEARLYAENVEALTKAVQKRKELEDIVEQLAELEKKELEERKEKQYKMAAEGEADELANIQKMTSNKLWALDLQNQLKKLDDAEKLNDEIKAGDASSIQDRLDKAFNEQQLKRAELEETLKQIDEAPDAATQEMLMRKASEQKSDMLEAASAVERLNDALKDIKVQPLQEALSKLGAPDMSNVNSLAQHGYMVNKSDDAARLEAMNNYEETQVELQRQIKDILETKSFAATAG